LVEQALTHAALSHAYAPQLVCAPATQVPLALQTFGASSSELETQDAAPQVVPAATLLHALVLALGWQLWHALAALTVPAA
jgi:hypothetical protein